MGPREILGLIEEASGTRMYEEKKEKALRTISKKEKKVEDIESVSFFIYGVSRQLIWLCSFLKKKSIPSLPVSEKNKNPTLRTQKPYQNPNASVALFQHSSIPIIIHGSTNVNPISPPWLTINPL
jgi:hypothetical protein